MPSGLHTIDVPALITTRLALIRSERDTIADCVTVCVVVCVYVSYEMLAHYRCAGLDYHTLGVNKVGTRHHC
jgi:hypothetical protein